MRVPREEFLSALEACEPGLARREIVEHSTSFIFRKGKVFSFNQELYCQARSPLGDKIEGAVQAKTLLNVLRKMPEDEVTVELSESELIIGGVQRGLEIRRDAEVMLPMDKLEPPKEWRRLHRNFPHALELVCECASKDEEHLKLTCIHLTPKLIEAFDGHQVIRYRVRTGVKQSTLVRSAYVKHTVQLGMTHCSETDNWFWFKNTQGMRLACRLFREDYKDLSPLFEVYKPSPASLPEGLIDAADRANEVSKEQAEDNALLVRMKKGRVKIVGQGQSAKYWETGKINYDGPPVEFLITPKMLKELASKYKDCEIGEDKLRVKGGKFTYIACLSPVEDNGEKEE